MSRSTPSWSPALERAIRWAAIGHAGQTRKGSGVPYVEHPMAVALILDRAGFPEDVLIAGLLHDLVEDTDATVDEVRARFGDEVARIVDGCSEVKLDPSGVSRPWADRKRDHLATLRTASVGTRAVILADKLHNLASIALDLAEGRAVWSLFNAGRAEVISYYRDAISISGTGDPRLETLADEASALLVAIEATGADAEDIPGGEG